MVLFSRDFIRKNLNVEKSEEKIMENLSIDELSKILRNIRGSREKTSDQMFKQTFLPQQQAS